MTLPAQLKQLGLPARDLPGFNLVAVLAIVAALYIGRDVLVPIALALLLSFLLAPAVRVLQKTRLPKSLSVGIVVFATCSFMVGFGWFVALEITGLANNLPGYQSTLREKIRSVRGATAGDQTLERASAVLDELRSEISRPSGSGLSGSTKPVPVEVQTSDSGPLNSLLLMLTPLIHPLTDTGLVILFVVFILLQREDLRNRLVVLGGTRDIQRTTAALDDAGSRLSRLFVAQLGLNISFGLVIGAGLQIIGVPSAPLWGALAAILRFVPYIGALLSAVFPLVLSAAVGHGWTMVVLTAALFLVAELIFGQILEPLIFGRSTGLSPVAIVLSATFWTWIWGPVGLVLATPLTVCLVVAGRHVEILRYFEIMLGDESPLTPQELVYQRLLAGDPVEIGEQARAYMREHSESEYLHEILIPGLALARNDEQKGDLEEFKQASLLAALKLVMEDLATLEESSEKKKKLHDPEKQGFDKMLATHNLSGPVSMPPSLVAKDAIFCTGGKSTLDDCAAVILAAQLTANGAGVALASSSVLGLDKFFAHDFDRHRLLCICFLAHPNISRIRYIARRLRKRAPYAQILVCILGDEDFETPHEFDEPGVEIAGSLETAIAKVISAGLVSSEPPATAVHTESASA